MYSAAMSPPRCPVPRPSRRSSDRKRTWVSIFSGLMAWMAATAGLARRWGIDGTRTALGWAALAAAMDRTAVSTAVLLTIIQDLWNQVNCDPIVMERRRPAMLQK